MRRVVSLLVAVLIVLATPAAAQSPTRGLSADSLTLDLTLLPDGSLDVEETITFRFTGRTFRQVDRRIPIRRTDGIIDVNALMDGRALGSDGDQRVSVRTGRRDLRARWRFPRTGDTTHSFTIRYRAMGVMQLANGRAELRWHVLPMRHRYEIGVATVRWRSPADAVSIGGPALEAEGWTWQREEDGWIATKAALAVDEIAVLHEVFEAGSLAVSTPVWQVDEERAGQLAPAFIVGAIVILVMGAGMLVMFSLRYHRPRVDRARAQPAEVGSLPSAMATALRNPHPRVGLAQGAAALFDLLQGGYLRLEQRSGDAPELVSVRRHAPGDRLPGHLTVVLDALWLRMKHGRMPLKQAQRELMATHRAFAQALREDLVAAGLIDRERQAAANGLAATGIVAMILGLGLLVVAAVWLAWLGDALLLVPGSVIVLGVSLAVAGEGFATVSRTGADLSARWAARARDLRTRARRGWTREDAEQWLPVAVGLGLGRSAAAVVPQAAWVSGVEHPAAVVSIIAAAATTPGGGVGTSGGGVGAGGGGFSGAR